jgi:MFS family permease
MARSADPTKMASDVRAADEGTPLIGAPDTVGGQAVQPNGHAIDSLKQPNGLADNNEEKPLPYIQILALCYAALVEPVAYFSIFPYINEMVEKTGRVEVSHVGLYSGLIESLFSLVQMLLMIVYGRLADRLGRKPVLIWSLAGMSCASALFGMSANLWQMVLFRCIAGLFGGSSVTIRAMLSENCTKHTQARAFSWYMFTKNLGIFIGPIIGKGTAMLPLLLIDTTDTGLQEASWQILLETSLPFTTYSSSKITHTPYQQSCQALSA